MKIKLQSTNKKTSKYKNVPLGKNSFAKQNKNLVILLTAKVTLDLALQNCKLI